VVNVKSGIMLEWNITILQKKRILYLKFLIAFARKTFYFIIIYYYTILMKEKAFKKILNSVLKCE
jgi:hypothetical protein